MEHYGLERLLVLVVADPGHKGTVASAEDRLELAQIAFGDIRGAVVALDTHSRTVDYLEEQRPEDAIFLLGGDELAGFADWKDPLRVVELIPLGVAMRPGVPEARLRELRAWLPAPDRISFFEMEPTPVSSTEIRDRVAGDEPIHELVPPAVAVAIARLGLYRDD
jgi:nicotinate-nucleotide adenylyltransferase